MIETEPFSLKNGLLSEIGKHQRPKMKDRYGESLEALYASLAHIWSITFSTVTPSARAEKFTAMR